MTKEGTAIILRESAAIIDAHTLLMVPVEELSVDTGLTAWSVLDLLEKNLIKGRKADLRKVLMDTAEELGERNAKGSFVYEVPDTDGKITKQCRAGKVTIDAQKVIQLLKKKKIDDSKVIIYEPKVDEKALEGLVAAGLITPEDLQKISDVGDPVWALTVKKPSAVTGLIKAGK